MLIPGMVAQRQYDSAPVFPAEAVLFDGVNDSMYDSSAVNGTSSKQGTASVWVNPTTDPTGFKTMVYSQSAGSYKFAVQMGTGVPRVIGRNTGNTIILTVNMTTAITAGSGWNHILFSWDLSTGTAHAYLNDIEDQAAGATLTNDTIQGGNNLSINGAAGTPTFDGDSSEYYYNDNEYLDLSVEANRRKFITSGGKPVDLGSNGSTPTGTQPWVYVTGDAAAWNAGTNQGTAGTIPMIGSVTDSTNEPVEVP